MHTMYIEIDPNILVEMPEGCKVIHAFQEAGIDTSKMDEKFLDIELQFNSRIRITSSGEYFVVEG